MVCKRQEVIKYRKQYLEKTAYNLKSGDYRYIELLNGKRELMSKRKGRVLILFLMVQKFSD